jgi:DNA-binding transcriptional LysR family regulator
MHWAGWHDIGLSAATRHAILRYRHIATDMGMLVDQIERIERRISLHDVRVLMSVVEAGSMGKAAKRLATSQPAISRSIADLEEALGARLLDRTPQGVEPTVYGRALLKRGLAVFDELTQGIKDIQFLADPTSGELRIGASIAVAVGFVSHIVDCVSRCYPRLAFEVLATDTATAYRALLERKVDLLVAHVIEPIEEERLETQVLFDDPHVVVAGVQNPLVRRRRLALRDLINEPWTLPPRDTPYGTVILDAFLANGLSFPNAVVTSTLPVRNTLLATGRFLSMMPRVVLQFPTHQMFKSLPIDLPITLRPLAVVTLKNRTLNPAARLFTACASKFAKAAGRRR